MADLEWLTKEGNLIKVAEGKYDNKKPEYGRGGI